MLTWTLEGQWLLVSSDFRGFGTKWSIVGRLVEFGWSGRKRTNGLHEDQGGIPICVIHWYQRGYQASENITSWSQTFRIWWTGTVIGNDIPVHEVLNLTKLNNTLGEGRALGCWWWKPPEQLLYNKCWVFPCKEGYWDEIFGLLLFGTFTTPVKSSQRHSIAVSPVLHYRWCTMGEKPWWFWVLTYNMDLPTILMMTLDLVVGAW